VKSPSAPASSSAALPSTERLRTELVESFRRREAALTSQVERLERETLQLLGVNHTLYDKAKALREQLEDAEIAPGMDAEELAALRADGSGIEVRAARDLEAAREEAREATAKLQQHKELALTQAEEFRRSLLEQQQQVARLAGDLDLARKEAEQARVLLTARASGDPAGGGMDAKEALEIKSMQRQLLEQLRELQDAAANARQRAESRRSREVGDRDAALGAHLQSQLSAAQSQLRTEHARAERAMAEAAELRDRLASMEHQLAQGGVGAEQLVEAQRALHAASSDKRVVEEERDRYKTMLRKSKAQLVALAQEVQYWRSKAGEYGVPAFTGGAAGSVK